VSAPDRRTGPATAGAGPSAEFPPPVREGMAIPLGVRPVPWYGHVRSSVVFLVILILVVSVGYPLLLTAFAQVAAPNTANGQPYSGVNQTNGSTPGNASPGHATKAVMPSGLASTPGAIGGAGSAATREPDRARPCPAPERVVGGARAVRARGD
jgi:hypothetical protein